MAPKATSPGGVSKPRPGVELDIARVAIGTLRPYPRNPRRGNIEAIKQSLATNGQYRPIVVNRRTGEILAGNHTWRAARELGWSEIAVTYLDVDDEQAARIVLADNRANDLSGYDNEALADLLIELPSLEGTGYDRDDLDALLADLGIGSGLEDDPPPLPAEPRTRPGEVFELGAHRLICADARDPEAYRTLLGDEQAELLWTDPPYGVSYEGKTEAKLRIKGDGRDGLPDLLGKAFAAADTALADGAPLYVAHPGGERSLDFGRAFLGAGWSLRQTLVWVKDSIVLGHLDYHYSHEQLLYGFKPGSGRLGRGGSGWHGDDAQASVLEFDRPKASIEHPTMKPPALIEHCLRNSSRPGALVLDPFAGSGSTLVACEASGRAARLIELDPRYCDVICDRYEVLAGAAGRRD
jgi:site-specific DNA-methyltransferase (adenine-specific)